MTLRSLGLILEVFYLSRLIICFKGVNKTLSVEEQETSQEGQISRKIKKNQETSQKGEISSEIKTYTCRYCGEGPLHVT